MDPDRRYYNENLSYGRETKKTGLQAGKNSPNAAHLLFSEQKPIGNPTFLEQVIDIQLSNLSVIDLFNHYKNVGFIYPQKKERIAPYLELIKKNWSSALQAKKRFYGLLFSIAPNLHIWHHFQSGEQLIIAGLRNTSLVLDFLPV